jgi:hypothetical protein
MIRLALAIFFLCVTPRQEVSFEKEIRPILEQRCQPCHFAGGKMYERLPFDRPETIVKLGEKLFTRIKSEQQRATIRKFLEQSKSRR